MKMPAFEVTSHSFGISVGWEDAERRYHFWLDGGSGLPKGDTLHSNLKAKPTKHGDYGHRKMSLTAKRWAPIISSMIEKIKADDLVAKAYDRAAAKARTEEADRNKKLDDAVLVRLDRAAALLPDEAGNVIRGLPEDIRLRFAYMLQQI